MPLSIRHSRQARRDLIDIWDYFDGVDAAPSGENLLREIEAKLAMLSQVPMAGPARSELAPALRSFSVQGYILYYSHNDTELRLVRVLHGARDITPDLFEP